MVQTKVLADYNAMPTGNKTRIFIVVPAFDEAQSVGQVVREIRHTYENVVVVDDGSEDLTAEVSREAGATVLVHLINRGQGAALKTGIDYALGNGAEIIVTFDSDGQHQAEDIARLIGPVLEGQVDVALGSRFLGKDVRVPLVRLVVLKLGIVFTRLISRIHVTDTHNGLRALSKLAASQIRVSQDRMAHASEILDEVSRLGLRYCEVPVRIVYNTYSIGKGQNSAAAFRIIWDFILGKWRR